MSDDTRLTVAIIARDAEQPLDETLASVQCLADETVVCDTGSRDSTPQVAECYQARLVRHAWSDDFAAARNAGLQAATGQWVLWLDAGETLDSETAERLRRFVDESADPQRAYLMLVRVPQSGHEIDAEQVARLRLMPNRPGLTFRGRVRESLVESLAAAGMQVDGLPHVIHRGLREHDPQVKHQRAQRNLVLTDKEIAEHGPQPEMLVWMAESLHVLGDTGRACQLLRHAISLSPPESPAMLEAYYGLLTTLNDDPSQRDDQLALCTKALEAFPLDAQLLCALGGYLQHQGQVALACRAYEAAFEHGTVNPQLWHLERIQEIAAICYSLTLQLQRRGVEAQQVLQRAIDLGWGSTRLRRQLLDLYIKHGRRDEALSLVEQLNGRTAPLRIAVRGACLAAAENWTAARSYLEAARNAGCRDPLCYRWLATVLLALGQTAEAQAVLAQWKTVEPTSPELEKLEALAGAPGAADTARRVDAADGPLRNNLGARALHRTSQAALDPYDRRHRS